MMKARSVLIGGDELTDYHVSFPQTWRRESVKWAASRKLTQSDVDEIEAKLAEFRRKRDAFAWRVQSFKVNEDAA